MISLRNAMLLLAVLLAAALAGCTKDLEPVPAACLAEPAPLLDALRDAPAAVHLSDGSRLSGCVSAARTDGDLQSLGISLGGVADRLHARAGTDPAAALQLGYLAGAVRAGARQASDGIADQLARRIGQLAKLDRGAGAAARAALQRGEQAGERRG